MKHIALPALAVAGAMTLAVVPAADAQTSRGSSAAVSGAATSTAAAAGSSAAGQEEMPNLKDKKAGDFAGTWNGVEWYYHADGQHVVKNKEDAEKDITSVAAELKMTVGDFADKAGYKRPGATTETTTAQSASSELSSLPMLPFARVGEVAGEFGGKQWFYNRDINFVVDSQDLVNQTVSSGQTGVKLTVDFAREIQRGLPINVLVSGGSSNPAPAAPSAPAVPQGSSGTADGNTDTTTGTTNAQLEAGSSQIGRLVEIVLPAVLIIGGISWYLNQDGRTYMSSSSRTTDTPTEQERASSESLLSSNRGEVQRQSQASSLGSSALGSSALGSSALGSSALGSSGQGSSDQKPDQVKSEGATRDEVRGIAAETGSNGFARGLFALVLASVLGAAAFHFGRKQLV